MEGDCLGLACTAEAEEGDETLLAADVGRDASTWEGEGSPEALARAGERPRRLFFRKIRS